MEGGGAGQVTQVLSPSSNSNTVAVSNTVTPTSTSSTRLPIPNLEQTPVSLATDRQAVQPASSAIRPASSSAPSTDSLSQIVSVSQTSLTVPPIPVTAQTTGRIYGSCPTVADGTISQQTMLLGSSSPSGSQAQMYLRTQMLILAPAATVTAVPSDLPSVSPKGSLPASTQVQTLALRAHLPGALGQSVRLSPSASVVSSLPKMSLTPLRSTHLSSGTISASTGARAQLSTAHHLLTNSSLCPAPLKQQLHLAPGQRGAHQLFIQHTATSHRQIRPIALQVAPQEQAAALSQQTRGLPAPLPGQPAQPAEVTSPNGPSPSEKPPAAAGVSAVSSLAHAEPPLSEAGFKQVAPLVSNSSTQSSGSNGFFSYSKSSTSAVSSTATPPVSGAPLTTLSPASLQGLSQASQVPVADGGANSVAKAGFQPPFQNLPPPQTVAVDLKMQPALQSKEQASGHTSMMLERVEDPVTVPENKTPTSTPPLLTHSANGERADEEDASSKPENSLVAGSNGPCVLPSRALVQATEEPPHAARSPPPLHPAAVRSSLPGGAGVQPSQVAAKPHILTHLIEGFVFHEGKEPFRVSHSAVTEDGQAALPENPNRATTNGTSYPDHDELMDIDNSSENSSDSDVDDMAVDDGGSVSDMLQCEFCGQRGYSHNFLRSRRFCSMTCVRRFNLGSTRRQGLVPSDRMSRWPHRPMGRRGRPPGRADGTCREHFLRQISGRLEGWGENEGDDDDDDDNDSDDDEEEEEEEDDDELPGPMTTRQRYRVECEQARGQEAHVPRGRRGSLSSDELPLTRPDPTQWTVDQVCSYINTIPGCAEVSEEFHVQEIDGQALLLLNEEHLVTAMNVKLGPALKICAHIERLKGP